MKYTEIDGKRYTISECVNCMFMEKGDDGYGAHCNHPEKKGYIDLEHVYYTAYDKDPVRIHEDCPLRDVQDQHISMDEIIGKMFKVQKGKGTIHEIKPCPFCGSTEIEEIYYDDEGDILEEWMMEEANNDGCDYKSWQEYLDANGYVFLIGCANCHGSVSSKDSIEDAWAKWNRRV